MFLLRPTLLLVFYGLPYNFSTVLRATSGRVYHNTSTSVYCNASIYSASLCMPGASEFPFRFFKIIYRYVNWIGTWNMFLFLVMWQEFESLSYECFFQKGLKYIEAMMIYYSLFHLLNTILNLLNIHIYTINILQGSHNIVTNIERVQQTLVPIHHSTT